MSQRVYAILAAEPSGDLQAAALIPHLRRLDPGATFIGVGGAHLREQGVELLVDTSAWGSIGVFEVLGRLPRIAWEYWKLRRRLLAMRPTLTVMIDSPALFMRLARPLKSAGLRTVYYFPPSAWTDNQERLRSIASRVDKVICTFRRNFEAYRTAGIPVEYFGHPMVDVVQPYSREEAHRALGMDDRGARYVALLPGSRLQEIRLMTPLLIEAARLLAQRYPDLVFLLPAASDKVYERLQELSEGWSDLRLHLVRGKTHPVLSLSRVALLASGSVSLEAGCLGTPMVLAYRVNRWDLLGVRLLMWLKVIKIGRIALPNLVLDEEILPELLQEKATPTSIFREAVSLFEEGPKRTAMLEDLSRMRTSLGSSPVVPRVAQTIAESAGAR